MSWSCSQRSRPQFFLDKITTFAVGCGEYRHADEGWGCNFQPYLRRPLSWHLIDSLVAVSSTTMWEMLVDRLHDPALLWPEPNASGSYCADRHQHRAAPAAFAGAVPQARSVRRQAIETFDQDIKVLILGTDPPRSTAPRRPSARFDLMCMEKLASDPDAGALSEPKSSAAGSQRRQSC
jgi:hypothetical protein